MDVGWVLVPLGLLVLFVLGRKVGEVSDAQRVDDSRVRAAAADLGLTPGPPGVFRPGESREEALPVPAFDFLGCCRGQSLRLLMSGTWNGTAVRVYEHSHTYSGESKDDTVTETLAWFTLDTARLPPFIVERNFHLGRFLKMVEKWRGEQPIELDPHPPFAQAHQVRKHPAHEVGDAEIRQAFSGAVLDYLALRPGLCVESLGRHVLLFRRRKRIDPGDMDGFLSETHGLVVALLGPAAGAALAT